MTVTLAKINTPNSVAADEINTSAVSQEMSVIGLPPGFVEPVDRPIVYIGGGV